MSTIMEETKLNNKSVFSKRNSCIELWSNSTEAVQKLQFFNKDLKNKN